MNVTVVTNVSYERLVISRVCKDRYAYTRLVIVVYKS